MDFKKPTDSVRLNIFIPRFYVEKLRAISYLSRKTRSKLVTEALDLLFQTPPAPKEGEKT